MVRVFDLSTGSVTAETPQATPTEAVDCALDMMPKYPPPAYEVTIVSRPGVTEQQFGELSEIAESADLYLKVAPWDPAA